MDAARPPKDRPLAHAALLAGAGALLGLVVNAARADGIRLDRPVLAASGESGGASCGVPSGAIAEIGVEDARSLRAEGALFVDARPAGDFAVGHVPDALHLPSRGESPGSRLLMPRLLAARTVVVYDGGGSCALARRLAEKLSVEGVADVRLMLPGFGGWEEAGEPAQSGSCEACELAGEP